MGKAAADDKATPLAPRFSLSVFLPLF